MGCGGNTPFLVGFAVYLIPISLSFFYVFTDLSDMIVDGVSRVSCVFKVV
jgi:hypothetical protein